MSEQLEADKHLELAEKLDPFALFLEWMSEARVSELNDSHAMSLALATPDGVPSVRMVLCQRYDARGFVFYTNAESRKGREIAANAHAALCFHWKSRKRQVRVEGTIVEMPAEDADAYFNSRPRMSRIGAWASAQSRPLASREELLARAAEFEARFPDEVPRPPYWKGFLVKPAHIEFWQDGEFRLHDRYILSPGEGDLWTSQRLYP